MVSMVHPIDSGIEGWMGFDRKEQKKKKDSSCSRCLQTIYKILEPAARPKAEIADVRAREPRLFFLGSAGPIESLTPFRLSSSFPQADSTLKSPPNQLSLQLLHT
jgi:hypothetical protein